MKPYVYIVVRKDIKKEWQLVQACHAALEAGYSTTSPTNTTHLVVLSADSEWELDEISLQLDEENIGHTVFNEGYCKVGNTALATFPMLKKEDGILKSLPLFKY